VVFQGAVETSEAALAEGAPDDHSLRAVRRKQEGERATDTVRAAGDHFFAPQRATGQRLALPLDIAAANSIHPSKYFSEFH
jgi:hypothetical protein